MKQFLDALTGKAINFFQYEAATKDRPLAFRIIVIALVAINIFFISFYILKNI
jgi:hypothetical protein